MKTMYKDTLFMLLGWVPIRVALKPLQKGGMGNVRNLIRSFEHSEVCRLQQGQVAAHNVLF